MTSRLRAGFTAGLLLTSLFTLAAQSPASAEPTGNCDGQLIDTADIRAGGRSFGTLRLYYNSSTRKNCAKASKASRLVGTRHYMSVWIIRCKDGTGETISTCDQIDQPTDGLNIDSGEFTSYAGPVHNKGLSAGLCIDAGVTMEVGSAFPRASIGGHCD